MSIFNKAKGRITDFSRHLVNSISPHSLKEAQKVSQFLQNHRQFKDQRDAKMKRNMDFVFKGDQWTDEEVDEKLGDVTLVFNFSEDYVEKFQSRLFPRSQQTGVMDVGVKFYNIPENSPELRFEWEETVLSSYRENKLPRILMEQGGNFLAGGAGCLYFPPDPLDPKKTKILSIDPKICMYEYTDGEITAFAYEYFSSGKHIVVYWDLIENIVLEDGKIKVQNKNLNNYVPFIWVPNYPYPHDKQAVRSKIDSLITLDQEYNKIASSYSERVAHNTEPPLVIYSDRAVKDSKIQSKIERGKKKKLFLGKDDRAEYIELQEGREILDYLKNIGDRMKSKTGVIQGGGGVKSSVSGLSFAFQYSDMLDHIGFMRVFWDEAFRKLNRAILTNKYGQGEYQSDPVYNQPFQFDQKTNVELFEKQLEMGVISKKGVIEELRGTENSEEKLREIRDEQIEDLKYQQKIGNLEFDDKTKI